MQQDDDLIKKLMDAGASDDEIVKILKEKNMQAAGASASVVSSVPSSVNKDIDMRSISSGNAFGDLLESGAKAAVRGSKEILNNLSKVNYFNFPVALGTGKVNRKDIFKDTKKPENLSLAQETGDFIGGMLPGMAISIPTSGMINPVAGPAGKLLLGGVAKAATKKFASVAMKEAVEAGITTIPQEVFSGAIAESLINPESFKDWKSTARVAALSSVGSIFNMGGAYFSAIKKANVNELNVLQQQLKESYDEIADTHRFPPVKPKEEIIGVQPDRDPQLRTAQEVALGNVIDKELPDNNQLPTFREAAARRINEKLQKEIETRLISLENHVPKPEVDPIAKAAANPIFDDPILLAHIEAVDDRLKQQLEVLNFGGKNLQTDTRLPLEGVSQPAYLTIDELNDHLRILNMASVASNPKFKKGQRFIVPRTQLMTADEIASRVTGGPIKGIDKTIQARFKDVQTRLDYASSRGVGTLDPEETKQVVEELLAMSKRLTRGFEVPYNPRLNDIPKSSKESLRYVDGVDLPTSAKISDPDFSENQLDPSHKRWVTGSDDPLPVVDIVEISAIPPTLQPPSEVPKIAYADAVRNANIDYNKQSKGIGKQILTKLNNFRQEFFSRTYGVGKYDKESGDLLQLLSGVPAHADDFVKLEMRIAVPDADGKYRGASKKVEGKVLGQLIDGIEADEVIEANAYLKAMTLRDSKLANSKFISDLSDETINSIIDNAPQKIKDFARDFKVIADALIEDSVNTGYMSVKRAEELRSVFYANLSRSFNESKSINPSLNRKGSLRTSKPPIDMMQDVIMKTLERNRKNAGYARFVDAYEANPNAFKDVIHRSDLPSSLDNIPEYKALVKQFTDDGFTYNEATQMAAGEVPLYDITNGTLRVFRNGQMSLWKVNDAVRRTYDSLNPLEFKILGAITSALSAPLRSTTSLALDYSLIGPLSDTILTAAKVPGFIPIVNSMEGLFHNVLKTDTYKEMRAAGASFGGRFESNQVVVYKDGVAKKIASVGNAINTPLKILQALINPLSNAARMGEYAVRRRGGESVLSAAMGAKTTLGDFNQVGASMRGWSLVTAFGNVGFQTADAANELRKFIIDEGSKGNFKPLAKSAATFTAAITLPTIYFWSAAQKDEELNAYRKSDTGYRNWWFRLPVDVPGIGDAGDIAKMPKLGWWAGQAFGSSVEAWLDGMGPDEQKRFMDGLWSQVGVNPIPLPAQQAFGFMTNTRNPLSFENKIPITPQNQVNLDASVQGNERTSPLARTLADKVGINPFKTDYLLDAAGGTFFGNIVRQVGPNTAQLEKSDTPLLGRFAVSKRASTEGSSQFYKDIDQARKFDESVTKALESGDVDKARKLMEENSVLVTLRKPMEKFVKDIGEINKFIYTISMDPQITPEGKREYINNLRDQQNALFRGYAEERKQWIDMTRK